MDSKMVFVLLSFTVAVVHCADLQSAVQSGDEENRIDLSEQLLNAMISDGHHGAVESGGHEVATATTTTETATLAAVRSGRQLLYQPFAYQPQPFPQRRAYRGPKKRPLRTKSGRRPRPHRRRPSGPPSSGRYRRLPGPVRAQQLNYIDAADYFEDDGGAVFESGPPQQSAMSAMSASPYADYVEREFDREQAAAYASAVVPSPLTASRLRKRPAIGGYADEPPLPPQVVHVPVVRVVRPAVTTTTAAAVTVDPMEKLRQLVHEAMDEHFSNRHQDLYTTDGTFDNKQQQRPQHVYSAKYKRQPAVDRDKAPAEQRTADAVRSAATAATPAVKDKDAAVQVVSYASSSDAAADGSDDRLTLAEISAYMGAKPAETVLSAGGHRYVLSDALQHSYRPQQLLQYGGDDHHQYLRYLSPFEAMYELPAARWTYKK